MEQEKVIVVKNVRKVYNRFNKKNIITALDNISFDIYRGKIFGFLGPNGSGKTTIIKIILGIITETSGEIKVFNEPPEERKIKNKIGYLPERLYYPDFTNPVKLLEFYGSLYDMNKKEIAERTDYVLNLVGLGDRKKTKIKEFSKGMVQRFGLAQALLHNPDLCIFDEPSSGLDPGGQRMVRDIMMKLRDEGKTIFFSSHHLTEAEMICNDVAIVNKGKTIVSAPLQELLTNTGDINLNQRFSIIFELPGNIKIEELKKKEELKEYHFNGTTQFKVILPGMEKTNRVIKILQDTGCSIISVNMERKTLEEIFLEKIGGVQK
jgi:ABC-2 type transport system ATP-binding protein